MLYSYYFEDERPTDHNMFCPFCKRVNTVRVDKYKWRRWKLDRGLIQNVWPDMPKDIREVMISGSCPACFDMAFPEED